MCCSCVVVVLFFAGAYREEGIVYLSVCVGWLIDLG